MDVHAFIDLFNDSKNAISTVQEYKVDVTGKINDILGNLNVGKTQIGDIMKFVRIYGISGVMRDDIYLITKGASTGDTVKKVPCNGIKITYNGGTPVSFEIFQNKNITQLDLQDYNKAEVVWDDDDKNPEAEVFREAMQMIADDVSNAFNSTAKITVQIEVANPPKE